MSELQHTIEARGEHPSCLAGHVRVSTEGGCAMSMEFAGDAAQATPYKLEAAARLLESCNTEIDHCRQVAELAGRLFDETAPLHGLREMERCLLVSGALLHDIGVSVTYQRHHKHSRDVILGAALEAFTSREQGIVANVARYHRKALPSEAHKHFAALRPGDRELVRKLAAIVRIADGLDRSHSNVVESVEARRLGEDAWEIGVSGRGSMSPEFWAVREKKAELFELVFGVELTIARTK